jgi:hypothetical protein
MTDPTPDDTGLLADAYVAYCSLCDDSKRMFLSMCQQDDPKRFKDCIPALRERTGILDDLPI